MSIRVGSVPLFQTEDNVFGVHSTRSNVLTLTSTDQNVLLNIGRFTFGQTSNTVTNSPAELLIKDGGDAVASFSKNSIQLYKTLASTSKIEIGNNIQTTGNIYSESSTASNLTLYNNTYGDTVLYMTSNGTPILTTTTTEQGTMYLAGQMGIGTTPHAHYSLHTRSNVYIHGFNYATNMYTRSVSYDTSVNGMYFTSSNVLIDSQEVLIRNLSLLGVSQYEDVIIKKKADFQGILFASNVVLTNKSSTTNPLKIAQKLNDGSFSSTQTGNPISVLSEYPVIGDVNILQVTPYGHMVMGDIPYISGYDYVLRAAIPENRASRFLGFLNFQNSNAEKSAFVVNPDGHLSIGNPQSISMLEVKNSFEGNEDNYGPPQEIISLQNAYYANQLPILRCRMPDDKIKLQITSNGTLCFTENPINVYKYDIESTSNSYFNNIEIQNLTGYNNLPINSQRSTLSNLLSVDTTHLLANQAEMSNVIIRSLVANSFTTPSLDCVDGVNDISTFKILSERLLFTGCNLVINRDPSYFSCNENLNLNTDSIRLFTTGKTTDIVQGYHMSGNHSEIRLRVNNTNTLGRITHEYETNENRFRMGVLSKNATPNASDGAVFFITPFISAGDTGGIGNETTAVTIYKDKTIKFGSGTYIDPSGILSIGNPITKPNLYNAYIKGGMTVTTSVNSTSLAIDGEKPYVGIATSVLGYNLQTNGTVYFSSNALPQFTISGNIGIGTQYPASPFQVSLETRFDRSAYFASNVVIQGRLDTLGNVASTSDSQIKSELLPISNALDKIDQLTGYVYTRMDTHVKETGLVAQEVLKVLPEAVSMGQNGLYTLAYGNMAGLFVQAIKELRKENADLREELRQLRRS